MKQVELVVCFGCTRKWFAFSYFSFCFLGHLGHFFPLQQLWNLSQCKLEEICWFHWQCISLLQLRVASRVIGGDCIEQTTSVYVQDSKLLCQRYRCSFLLWEKNSPNMHTVSHIYFKTVLSEVLGLVPLGSGYWHLGNSSPLSVNDHWIF